MDRGERASERDRELRESWESKLERERAEREEKRVSKRVRTVYYRMRCLIYSHVCMHVNRSKEWALGVFSASPFSQVFFGVEHFNRNVSYSVGMKWNVKRLWVCLGSGTELGNIGEWTGFHGLNWILRSKGNAVRLELQLRLKVSSNRLSFFIDASFVQVLYHLEMLEVNLVSLSVLCSLKGVNHVQVLNSSMSSVLFCCRHQRTCWRQKILCVMGQLASWVSCSKQKKLFPYWKCRFFFF